MPPRRVSIGRGGMDHELQAKIYGESAQPLAQPMRKSGKRKTGVVKYDPKAKQEFVKGFRKRKQERKKASEEWRKQNARQQIKEARANRRAERKGRIAAVLKPLDIANLTTEELKKMIEEAKKEEEKAALAPEEF
eukprot:gnl/Chilomastix_cuspidata/1321.p2 GENE.gnl/Chilomastix_cuspidata/1321~~gnl/Chilomastix_cuspidata/1321.p2  ORF type:complete len:135 (+),score=54.27 gnl/Chilomastix_cuspidata/1321:14-418(+)